MRLSILQLSARTLRTIPLRQTPTICCARSFRPSRSQQATRSPSRAYYSTEIQPKDASHVAETTVITEGAETLAVKRDIRWDSNTIPPEGEPAFAFAFDIDGVLLRSSNPVKGARRSINFLAKHNIPFILLTNGGGKHESQRVEELSQKLGIPLSEKNFVQSHTPFAALVEGSGEHDALKDKTILVTGANGDKCREIAEQYGFKNVITPDDILHAYPKIWPFVRYNTHQPKRSLPAHANPVHPKGTLKIDAIFVYNDPRDWAVDSQVILDLLLSKEGYLGTYSAKNGDETLPNRGWQQDNQPKLYFSNPDLFWATDYHLPRFGQGAFQAALQGVWNATTGGAMLEKTVIGKPHAHTYEYAEKVLDSHHTEMMQQRGVGNIDQNRVKRVYMVGDNPESDIRGANEFKSPRGTEWNSILVKTGVYKDGTVPAYTPKVIVDNVSSAIRWALKKEGYRYMVKNEDSEIVSIEEDRSARV